MALEAGPYLTYPRILKKNWAGCVPLRSRPLTFCVTPDNVAAKRQQDHHFTEKCSVNRLRLQFSNVNLGQAGA